MRALLLSHIALQYITTISNAENCVYTDSGTGVKLYLSALEHSTLSAVADESLDEHTYTYTPCRNAAGTCPNSQGSGGTHTSMVRQTIDTDSDVCVVIADVDSSVNPTYNPSSFDGNGSWTFQYRNGDQANCDGPRELQVELVCDLSAGDYTVDSVGMRGIANDGKCRYVHGHGQARSTTLHATTFSKRAPSGRVPTRCTTQDVTGLSTTVMVVLSTST